MRRHIPTLTLFKKAMRCAFKIEREMAFFVLDIKREGISIHHQKNSWARQMEGMQKRLKQVCWMPLVRLFPQKINRPLFLKNGCVKKMEQKTRLNPSRKNGKKKGERWNHLFLSKVIHCLVLSTHSTLFIKLIFFLSHIHCCDTISCHSEHSFKKKP